MIDTDVLSLQVIAVELGKLRSAVGSCDEALVAAATRRLRVPPWDMYNEDNGGLGPCVEHLVMKTAAPDRDLVGFALQMLAAVQGKTLAVSAWNTFAPSAVDDVDKALQGLDVKLVLSEHLRAGAPVTLPALRSRRGTLGPRLAFMGFAEAEEVVRGARSLADAVTAGTAQRAAVDRCEMRLAVGKKHHLWFGKMVGTDVEQRWQAPSGKMKRQADSFKNAEAAKRTYQAFIADRAAEGYVVTSHTEAGKSGVKKAVDAKSLVRIEEARDWYAAAAKAKRALVFFAV